MSHTPLPHLHDQLVAAARALDAATAPRRRPRRRWAALGVIVALSGTGVAVARVAQIGPFAYLDRFGETIPTLRPQEAITIESGDDTPRWLARAFTNQHGDVCLTGGPRDPRSDVKPSSPAASNPPASGVMCTSTDELAPALIDKSWGIGLVAAKTDLNGSLNGNAARRNASGMLVRVGEPPTRTLVFAFAPVDFNPPVVRVGLRGEAQRMRPSEEVLTVKVNRSPQGLDARERKLVAQFPERLTLRLWAAEVAIPRMADGFLELPEPVAYQQADNTSPTIQLLTGAEMRTRSTRDRERATRRYEITRDPAPVRGASTSAKRWIAAFARPRRDSDAVRGKLSMELRSQRAQPTQARRLSTTGNVAGARYWILPGASGNPFAPQDMDAVCILGVGENPISRPHGTPVSVCKLNSARWKVPFAETIACSPELAAGEALVWALAPPGTRSVEVFGPDGKRTTYKAGELLILRQSRAALPARLRWLRSAGAALTQKVPRPSLRRRCRERTTLIRDSTGAGQESADLERR